MLVLQAGEGVLPDVAGPTAARDEASAMAQQLLVLIRVAEVHSELGGQPVEEIHVCGGEVLWLLLLLCSPPLRLCRKQTLTHTDTQADAHCTDGAGLWQDQTSTVYTIPCQTERERERERDRTAPGVCGWQTRWLWTDGRISTTTGTGADTCTVRRGSAHTHTHTEQGPNCDRIKPHALSVRDRRGQRWTEITRTSRLRRVDGGVTLTLQPQSNSPVCPPLTRLPVCRQAGPAATVHCPLT